MEDWIGLIFFCFSSIIALFFPFSFLVIFGLFGIPFFWWGQLCDTIVENFLWILFLSFFTEGLPSFCVFFFPFRLLLPDDGIL